MPYRPVLEADLDEIFQRYQQGENLSVIARGVGWTPDTVRAHLRAAMEAGLTRGGDEPQRRAAVTAVMGGYSEDGTSLEELAMQRRKLALVKACLTAWAESREAVEGRMPYSPGHWGWFPADRVRAEALYRFLGLSDKYAEACRSYDEVAAGREFSHLEPVIFTFGEVRLRSFSTVWEEIQRHGPEGLGMDAVEDAWETLLLRLEMTALRLGVEGFRVSPLQFVRAMQAAHAGKPEAFAPDAWPECHRVHCVQVNTLYDSKQISREVSARFAASIGLRHYRKKTSVHTLERWTEAYRLYVCERVSAKDIAKEHSHLFEKMVGKKKADYDHWIDTDSPRQGPTNTLKAYTKKIRELLEAFEGTGELPALAFPKTRAAPPAPGSEQSGASSRAAPRSRR